MAGAGGEAEEKIDAAIAGGGAGGGAAGAAGTRGGPDWPLVRGAGATRAGAGAGVRLASARDDTFVGKAGGDMGVSGGVCGSGPLEDSPAVGPPSSEPRFRSREKMLMLLRRDLLHRLIDRRT